MTVRRSLFLLSFFAIAGAVSVSIVACGPKDQSVKVEKIAPVAKGQALAKCKDEIRRYESKVKETTILCVAKDPNAAAAFTGNLLGPKLGSPTETPTEVAPPPAAKPSTIETAYEAKEIPLSYTVGHVKDQIQVTLKLDVKFPKDTPEMTSKWALYVVNAKCLPQIREFWQKSEFGVALEIPEVKMATEGVAVDQTIEFAGPENLAASSYPVLPMKVWPSRASLLPRGSQAKLDECKGDQKCVINAIVSANESFCRDFSLLVGHFLGLNKKAPAEKGRCEKEGAMPKPLKADTFVNNIGHEGVDKPFSPSDLRSILSPACKSAR